MAKGTQFQFRRADEQRPQQPAAAVADRHAAPGPQVEPCCECGDVIGPWWGENGETFCRRHAPEHLKRPGAARDAS